MSGISRFLVLSVALICVGCAEDSGDEMMDGLNDHSDQTTHVQYLGSIDMSQIVGSQSYTLARLEPRKLYVIDINKPGEYEDTFGIDIEFAAAPDLSGSPDNDVPPELLIEAVARGVVYQSTTSAPLPAMAAECVEGCPSTDLILPPSALVAELNEGWIGLESGQNDSGVRIVFGFVSFAPESASLTLRCTDNCIE